MRFLIDEEVKVCVREEVVLLMAEMTEEYGLKDLDFATGAMVHCRDGTCGRLLMVVADPHTRRITDLIIEGDHLRERAYVLPVSDVERTTSEHIYLSISSDELTNYPRYRETEMTAPAPDWRDDRYRAEDVRYRLSPYGSVISESILPMICYQVQEGIPSTAEIIERGTPVHGMDGLIGKVDHILADRQSGEISHLVVQRRTEANYHVIPAQVIESLKEEGITVSVSAEEVADMPRYRPRAKRDTLAELRDRFAIAPVTEFGEVGVSLQHDVAHLTGIALDAEAKGRAERLARSVEGVIEVENALDTDSVIADRVSQALTQDPRTRKADIEVHSSLGAVTLSGEVLSSKIREAASEIAREQPGVVAVTDQLKIAEDRVAEAQMEGSNLGGTASGNPAYHPTKELRGKDNHERKDYRA